MRAVINGETRELPERTSVAALLELLGAPPSGIAVARNDKVVPGSKFTGEFIAEGDSIEIIRAVAGG